MEYGGGILCHVAISGHARTHFYGEPGVITTTGRREWVPLRLLEEEGKVLESYMKI